jgi:hypothetical protein
MRTPRPDGWVGGKEDFDFVRTFQGHLGVNPYLENNADFDDRRNASRQDVSEIDGD